MQPLGLHDEERVGIDFDAAVAADAVGEPGLAAALDFFQPFLYAAVAAEVDEILETLGMQPIVGTDAVVDQRRQLRVGLTERLAMRTCLSPRIAM